jgi:3,4-dihydroxyphenylacetate 2,3-dioxygenase
MLTPHAWLVPHLPTLLLDERREADTDMIAALEVVRARFVADAPEVVVAVSARWVAAGPFLAGAARRHETLTDYHGFGVELRYDCPGDPPLAQAIVDDAQRAGLRAETTTARGIDSAITVPMHFMAPDRSRPVVPLSLSTGSVATHRAWGASVRETLARRPARAALVVGGMLSHNVHAWNLHRDVPESRALDEQVLERLGRGEWASLGALAARQPRAAAEAGLRHLEVLRGFLGHDLPGVLACYESSPGVGAALVEFTLEPVRPAHQPG